MKVLDNLEPLMIALLPHLAESQGNGLPLRVCGAIFTTSYLAQSKGNYIPN